MFFLSTIIETHDNFSPILLLFFKKDFFLFLSFIQEN